MTKEQRDNYNGLLHCKICNYDVPVGKIDPKKIHPDYSINRCKVCEWIDNHSEEVLRAKNDLSMTDEEILKYLHLIYFGDTFYLNDIAELMDKSLDEMLEIYTYLHVANKKVRIKFNCEACGTESSMAYKAYMNSKYHYCSHECYYKDKSSKCPKGEDNPYYNRITTQCSNCNKEMSIIPYRLNLLNQYGDSHNFCCKECYWEYRSKYYIKEKTYNYNRTFTEEEKEVQRIHLLNRLSSDKRLDTTIQLKINEILNNLGIEYVREKVFDYYAVDNFLINENGIIEVMGDYWHSNPLIYNSEKRMLNDMQSNQLHRDKLKHSYIANHYDINILYLWETNINKNIELCEKLIQYYIDNNCMIENYHSFNWHLDPELKINDSIIIPYQDVSVNEYRYLINSNVS